VGYALNHTGSPLAVLRDTESFLAQIKRSEGLTEKAVSLLIAGFVCFAIYGAIMGAYHSPLQALSSALKFPLLFLITALICLPTLYVLSLVLGQKETVGQYLVVLLGTLASTGILLVGFAPITAFFLMTSSHYQFFKLLNVAVVGISGIIGARFFLRAMRTLWQENREARDNVLLLWIVLYAFVGSQLGWTLRPFFGAPDMPFEPVREVQGNFYINIIKSAREVLGFD